MLALGSNLGDRLAALRAALAGLDALPDAAVAAVSRAYETDPVGPPGQGPYLNAAAVIHTAMAPYALLAACQRLEADAGRPPLAGRVVWGPRTLDLDLLMFDDVVVDPSVDDPDALVLPHPRMHQRWFVLRPLCDVAPDAVHPALNRRIADLLAELEAAAPQAATP